ncbi:MAG: hypothetical protein FWE22_02430 [Firmicutes bacterium]|nr:hypothetical protein [Bacillota bacterium]
MIVILAIGLVLSLGGGALLSWQLGDSLPFVSGLYGTEGFVLTMGLYALAIMTPFMIIALILAIVSKTKKKPEPVISGNDDGAVERIENLLHKGIDDIRRSVEGKSNAVLEREIDLMKQLLEATLNEAMEKNETVPLLKKMNAENEATKINLAVLLKEKNAKLTALLILNEKLEKKNYALRKVIDDALDPYCIEQTDIKVDKTLEHRSDYQGEKNDFDNN